MPGNFALTWFWPGSKSVQAILPYFLPLLHSLLEERE